MTKNTKKSMRNVALGMAAGAMLGAIVKPRKKNTKKIAGKALKAAGELVENFTSSVMG